MRIKYMIKIMQTLKNRIAGKTLKALLSRILPGKTNRYGRYPDFMTDKNGLLVEYNGPGGEVAIPEDSGITAI